MITLEDFRKFAEEAQRKIREAIPRVMDELTRLKEDGRFVELVCLGRSREYSCWVGNKRFFDVRNRLRSIAGDSLQERLLREDLEKMLKTMDEPSIAVMKGDLKFSITCPFYDTDICPLKDFSYTKKEEEL